jgi:hypothetical protein
VQSVKKCEGVVRLLCLAKSETRAGHVSVARMSHGHGGHGHGAEDPFDRRVAVTMAILAAFLAFVTMLDHNAHNQTLVLQGEANRLQTESNIFHTQASDAWGHFQAKNIRAYQTQANLGLVGLLQTAPSGTVVDEWKAQAKKYEGELPKLQAEAETLVKKTEASAEASKAKLEESHHIHHRGLRLDLAELAVELGLVICSISILSKRKSFWLSGIVCSVAGAGLCVWSLF